MKNIKKSLAMVVAALLLFILSAPAYAATANVEGHDYVTYQIFKGTQAEGDERLASIEWGSGIDGAAFLSELQQNAAFAGCKDVKDVAEVMQEWSYDSAEVRAFAKLAYKYRTGTPGGTTGLDAGYYLVVDVTEFDPDATNTVRNLALLQLTQKGDFEIRNKVSIPEVNKKVKDVNDSQNATSDWQDSADYDIGDDVPFMLTAKLASIADYDTYKLVFHDKLSAGLTFNADSVVVKIDGEQIDTSAYTVSSNGDLTITIEDVKAYGAVDNSKVTVEYTAKLNENAAIGGAGNPNEVYLEYSNNPNESGKGNDNTGKTPTDRVIVFTYKLVIFKVNENGEALNGATFELLKKNAAGEYVSLGQFEGEESSVFAWEGLDDGDYKLVEVEAPNGYNKIEDIEFTITANHQILSDNPILEGLHGGDGFTGDVLTGTVSGTVANEPGITLPETGGIGTTIFYVLGAFLLVSASVILIARKRMGEKQ